MLDLQSAKPVADSFIVKQAEGNTFLRQMVGLLEPVLEVSEALRG